MKGVLLVNLGSPDSPTPKDVKKYLGEFLMDERVIDVPKWALFRSQYSKNSHRKNSRRIFAKKSRYTLFKVFVLKVVSTATYISRNRYRYHEFVHKM